MIKYSVSVIVPVYGVEKYIDKCLKSLVSQTLKDIEIIVVNDGSKDNSQKIISKALKISIIFSLLIVYVVTVYNPKIICNNSKDVYNLLVTVILIPIIYDSIKSKS